MHPDEGGGRRWPFATFPTTEWTVVVAAGEEAGARQKPSATREAEAALDRLYKRYRTPILVYLTRQGHSPEDAEDLAQSFLREKLIQADFLKGRSEDKGRFRTWVLRSLENFVRDQRRSANAKKRGGGARMEPLDPVTGTVPSGRGMPGGAISPLEAFDLSLANTLVANVFGRLKEEYAQKGKTGWFDLFEPLLYDDSEALSYRDIAARIGTTESGARSAASRARGRLRFLIRDEVARIVADPSLIEDEMRHLMEALRRRG